MIVVLKKGCPKDEVERLTGWIEHFHVSVNPIVGEETTILGLVGDTSAVDKDTLMLNQWVDRVMKVQEPFKLANRQMHPENTVVDINGVKVGGNKLGYVKSSAVAGRIPQQRAAMVIIVFFSFIFLCFRRFELKISIVLTLVSIFIGRGIDQVMFYMVTAGL